jgi:hypothetical protein
MLYIHDGVLLSHKEKWFEGKWVQLEDIMLSDVSQAQKEKGCIFSLVHGRKIQKINKNKHDHM